MTRSGHPYSDYLIPNSNSSNSQKIFIASFVKFAKPVPEPFKIMTNGTLNQTGIKKRSRESAYAVIEELKCQIMVSKALEKYVMKKVIIKNLELEKSAKEITASIICPICKITIRSYKYKGSKNDWTLSDFLSSHEKKLHFLKQQEGTSTAQIVFRNRRTKQMCELVEF